MPLILTTPPATEPVTLAEAKAHLRITHADDDAVISTLIKTARQQLETRTGVGFITQAWSLFLDDWPETGEIRIPIAPVLDVTDIRVWSDADVSSTIDPAHYLEDRASKPPRIVLRGSRSWVRPGRIANGIEVQLSVGYGAGPASVPEPLRQAILELAAHWFASRGDEAAQGEPLAIAQLIAPYREVRL
jgi:uncharacterized phiE125 gp8 family phage protein